MAENLANWWSELHALSSDSPAPVDTEARIAAAALELFAEHSYEAATTQAIAKRAGVTERTLFKHFKNKERLFTQTVYPALFKLIRPVAINNLYQLLQDRQGDFRATIHAIVEERVKFALQHPTIVKLVTQELLLRPSFREAAFKFIGEQMAPSLEAFFSEARATGQMKDIPTAVAIRTLVFSVVGFGLTRIFLFPTDTEDLQPDIDLITSLLLDGLAT